MTTAVGQTVRERVLEASTSLLSIDSVVLTTFSFGAAFVEEHALPAVLGLDGPATPARRQAVHHALAETPVTVTFDATTGAAPTGRYRYLAIPVPVVARLFHPKTILISGRGIQGERRVWLGVGSANLTMSGWGRNAESFGGVWLRSQQQQATGAATAFVAWLVTTTGIGDVDSSEALARTLAALEELPDSAEGAGREPAVPAAEGEPRLYVSTVHTDGFARFVRDISAGSTMRVLSPYWSELPSSIEQFGAAGVELVPALRRDIQGVNLARAQTTGLSPAARLLRNRRDDGGRFWHAKAYEFRPPAGTPGSYVTSAVGSCNFSGPGLRGGSGNVEVMLVRQGVSAGLPSDDEMSPLDVDELPELLPEQDETPAPLTVAAVVIWDWAARGYKWLIDDGVGDRHYELHLPGDSQAAVIRGRGSCEGAPPSQGDQFRLNWPPDGEQFGSIVEVNLHLSPRTYGRRLRASEILDSWRGRPVYVGGDGDTLDDAEQSGDAGTHDGGEQELPFDAFDLYEFYRSLRRLEAAVGEQTGRPSVQQALLVTRPDSVWAMAQLTAESDAPAPLRFMVLSELAQVAGRHPAAVGKEARDRLDAMSTVARDETIETLASEVGSVGQATEMVAWFEQGSASLGGAS